MTGAGFRVRGKVQGVGFRWWTRSLAARLGLSGTVANEPDGSVTVHVRGPEEKVREMEARLAEGPPHARVDHVASLPFSADVADGEFRVLH